MVGGDNKRSPQEMMDMLREKLRGRGTGPRRDDLGSPLGGQMVVIMLSPQGGTMAEVLIQ